MNKKNLLLITSVLIILSCIIMSLITTNNTNVSVEKKEESDTEKDVEEEVKEEEYELSLVMVGDYLIHGAIADDAKTTSGKYDFSKILTNIKPIIKEYDLAFYNQESILGGSKLGVSSYPRFNSPQEAGDAMLDAGFNLVSLANNHTLDRGKEAIYSSLAYWKSKDNVLTAGSYSSEEDRINPKIIEKNGITYAFLSYTTTLNGLTRPKDEPYLITTYNNDDAKKDIERLRDKVDLLIVSMHWGEEYSHVPNQSQKDIANYLSSLGVDIIIGHHPHVIQPIEFIGNTMVIYSLGNFLASQYGVEKLTGMIASVNIKKSIKNGQVTITLENPTVQFTYTYSKKTSYRYGYIIYPYTMLNDNLLKNYRQHYEKFKGIVTSMSDKISVIPVNF